MLPVLRYNIILNRSMLICVICFTAVFVSGCAGLELTAITFVPTFLALSLFTIVTLIATKIGRLTETLITLILVMIIRIIYSIFATAKRNKNVDFLYTLALDGTSFVFIIISLIYISLTSAPKTFFLLALFCIGLLFWHASTISSPIKRSGLYICCFTLVYEIYYCLKTA